MPGWMLPHMMLLSSSRSSTTVVCRHFGFQVISGDFKQKKSFSMLFVAILRGLTAILRLIRGDALVILEEILHGLHDDDHA